MPLTRRQFNTALVATAAVLPRAARCAETKLAGSRPNILFAIADDWSWPHAGAYGDRAVKTPAFDRLAREGALVAGSFCVAPTCTASRGGILTGQPPHRLENGANLWSTLPPRFTTYPDLLEKAGYFIGLTGKGWGPGALGQRTRNPAGPQFRDFAQFLQRRPADKPFCYWFGSQDPHRPYDRAFGRDSGIKPADVVVPPYLPDTPEVRDDLVDYLAEVQRFDSQIANLLRLLDEQKLAENTFVVVTSDNGLPFPRAKANLYDAGTHMPLAIRWPGRIEAGLSIDPTVLISHLDFAPTFLELAGLPRPPEMSGRSLLPLLAGSPKVGFDAVFTERERHATARAGNVGYPSRAVRTRDWLHIRNFAPNRWPAGDGDYDGAQSFFSDIDSGPTKKFLLDHRSDKGYSRLFELACAKRPPEELYDLRTDPHQLKNLADDPTWLNMKHSARKLLEDWMRSTLDPRVANPATDVFDNYPYVNATGATRPARPASPGVRGPG